MEKGPDGKRHKKTKEKVEFVRKCDERDKFIEQFGKEKFKSETVKGKTFEKYVDIPVPEQYQYVWEHFLTIWTYTESDFNGKKVFTFGTVRDYEQCYGYSFSIKEKNLFFKMRNWAMEVLNELDNS